MRSVVVRVLHSDHTPSDLATLGHLPSFVEKAFVAPLHEA
jgi:hypothetical protein